jgi:hypothetical protein
MAGSAAGYQMIVKGSEREILYRKVWWEMAAVLESSCLACLAALEAGPIDGLCAVHEAFTREHQPPHQ